MPDKKEISEFMERRNAMLRRMLLEDRKPYHDIEEAAGASAGHVGKGKSDGHTDWHECSCGWKSPLFSDGREYAEQKWIEHLLEEGVVIDYDA